MTAPSRVFRLSDKAVVPGICLTGLAVELSFWPGAYDPLAAKTMVLYCGAALVVASWLVKCLERRSFAVPSGALPVLVPGALYYLSALVSYCFVTSAPDVSLGTLLNRTAYFAVFAVAALDVVEPARRIFLVRGLLLTAAPVALYGLAQHFGLDPLAGSPAFEGRIYSTIGNPNHYAGFLTLMVALSWSLLPWGTKPRQSAWCLAACVAAAALHYGLYSAVTSVPVAAASFAGLALALFALARALTMGRSWAAVLFAFLLLVNILATSSRSGQIGLAACVVGFSVLALGCATRLSTGRRRVLLASSAAVAVALTLAGTRHITSQRPNSVPERKYFLVAALELVQQRPVLGHGIGTFKITYPRVKPLESWAYDAVCFQYVPNVYNEHVEVLHDEGAIGFLLYAWLMAAVFWVGVRSLRRSWPDPAPGGSTEAGSGPDARFLLAALLTGVFGLLVGNAFSLSLRYPSSAFFFWLFAGLVASGAAAKAADERSRPQAGRSLPARALQGLLVAAALAVCVMSFYRFTGEVYLSKALRHSKSAFGPAADSLRESHGMILEGSSFGSDAKEWERAVANYAASLERDPHNLWTRYFLGNAFARRGLDQPSYNPAWGDWGNTPRTDMQRALHQYYRILRQAPHFAEVDFELGSLYARAQQYDSAIACFVRYRSTKPFFTKLHFSLARCYVATQNWPEARESYEKALELTKDFTQAAVDLAAVYRRLGETSLSEEYFGRVRELSPRFAELLMAEACDRMGDLQGAIDFCNRSAERFPNDALTRYSLARLYERSGQNREAAASFRRVLEIGPGYADAQQRLAGIEGSSAQ